MEMEVPLLAGYLNIPTQSGFSLNRISKKKSCQRYCLLFKSSRHGIERLEICESKEDKNPKIITLENCVKITQGPHPSNFIQIVKKTGTLTLNALTEDDLKEWINALQTVAFREKGGTQSHNTAMEEDNDLYCSSYGDGLFIVTLIPSDASIRSSIEAKTYMLHLTATELQLKLTEDLTIIVAKWPYRFIRKYGYRQGKFTFEAGRKCYTGEGIFTLDHTNPQEVFRCMSSKMKSMKKLINSENLNSIDCGENQLSAAAYMEAGSRSPLPPSPSNQHNNDFEMNSTPSCISSRGFISSSDSLNNFALSTISNNFANPVKIIPNKPPRKLLPPPEKPSLSPAVPNAIELKSCGQQIGDKFKKFQNYEPVSISTSIDPNKIAGSTVILNPQAADSLPKPCPLPQLPARNETTISVKTERNYESIETITDAWKTLGVNDVKHTERNLLVTEDEPMNFVPARASHRDKSHHKDVPSPMSAKIIDIDIGEGNHKIDQQERNDVNYDRLDFLSPNHTTSSGYKTIVTVSSPANATTRMRCSSPTHNDYELIANMDMQPCRKADDTHLGYGVLRKATICSPTVGVGVGVTNAMFNVQINNNNNNSNNSGNSSHVLVDEQPPLPGKMSTYNEQQPPDHRSYNGLNYTIVSKPKRV